NVVDPSHGRAIAEVPERGVDEVERACAAAVAARPTWTARGLAPRLEAMRRFAARVAERKEYLAQTLTAETGKPIVQARNELSALAERLDFFLDTVPEV